MVKSMEKLFMAKFSATFAISIVLISLFMQSNAVSIEDFDTHYDPNLGLYQLVEKTLKWYSLKSWRRDTLCKCVAELQKDSDVENIGARKGPNKYISVSSPENYGRVVPTIVCQYPESNSTTWFVAMSANIRHYFSVQVDRFGKGFVKEVISIPHVDKGTANRHHCFAMITEIRNIFSISQPPRAVAKEDFGTHYDTDFGLYQFIEKILKWYSLKSWRRDTLCKCVAEQRTESHVENIQGRKDTQPNQLLHINDPYTHGIVVSTLVCNRLGGEESSWFLAVSANIRHYFFIQLEGFNTGFVKHVVNLPNDNEVMTNQHNCFALIDEIRNKFSMSDPPMTVAEEDFDTHYDKNFGLYQFVEKNLRWYSLKYWRRDILCKCVAEVRKDENENVENVQARVRPRPNERIDISSRDSNCHVVSTVVCDLSSEGKKTSWFLAMSANIRYYFFMQFKGYSVGVVDGTISIPPVDKVITNQHNCLALIDEIYNKFSISQPPRTVAIEDFDTHYDSDFGLYQFVEKTLKWYFLKSWRRDTLCKCVAELQKDSDVENIRARKLPDPNEQLSISNPDSNKHVVTTLVCDLPERRETSWFLAMSANIEHYFFMTNERYREGFVNAVIHITHDNEVITSQQNCLALIDEIHNKFSISEPPKTISADDFDTHYDKSFGLHKFVENILNWYSLKSWRRDTLCKCVAELQKESDVKNIQAQKFLRPNEHLNITSSDANKHVVSTLICRHHGRKEPIWELAMSANIRHYFYIQSISHKEGVVNNVISIPHSDEGLTDEEWKLEKISFPKPYFCFALIDEFRSTFRAYQQHKI